MKRLAPQIALPPYAFVPGVNTHPKHPGGHSCGSEESAVTALDPGYWRACEAYLYGLDLFNAGYYWEAHEQFEGLWIAAGRTGTVADFLKGLIKLAAAGVKHREGVAAGVRSHATRAAELLCSVARTQDATEFLGFELAALVALAEDVGRQGWPAAPPVLTPTVLGS